MKTTEVLYELQKVSGLDWNKMIDTLKSHYAPGLIMGTAFGLTSALAATAYQKTSEYFKTKAGTKKIEESFNTMMTENPEFKENKNQAIKMFDIVSSYAPAMASNPTMAGSVVKHLSSFPKGIIDPNLVLKLTEIQKNYDSAQDIVKSPMDSHLFSEYYKFGLGSFKPSKDKDKIHIK
jgi:hypothetical protein